MKKYIIAVLISMICGVAYSADNSGLVTVTTVASRVSDAHNLFFSGAVPSQGCTYNDRAVIEETESAGGKALLSVALMAQVNQNFIVVSVDGCTPLNPPLTATAPRVVMLRSYSAY